MESSAASSRSSRSGPSALRISRGTCSATSPRSSISVGMTAAPGRIVLEDQRGHSQAVPPDALKQLFATLKDDIRCVVLNACFTEPQAEAIAGSIDCVVGMSAGDRR